jgi:enterochelin esterase-like enzyme
VDTGSINLEYLPYSLNFRIYLPPCYDDQPGRRYPVLYLIHGQFYTDDQWVRLGVPGLCDALITQGDTAPFLVVMPRDQAWKQPSEDPFGQALLEGLLPWVETHYRTLPGRENRAIGGLSRGAAWAVHLGLSQWKSFAIVGAHSLPVFWEDVTEIESWIDQIPLVSFPRLFLDVGDHDRPEVLESAAWFEALLTEKGIPHEWHLFSGEHEETYWFAHVEQYLRWYAADW